VFARYTTLVIREGVQQDPLLRVSHPHCRKMRVGIGVRKKHEGICFFRGPGIFGMACIVPDLLKPRGFGESSAASMRSEPPDFQSKRNRTSPVHVPTSMKAIRHAVCENWNAATELPGFFGYFTRIPYFQLSPGG